MNKALFRFIKRLLPLASPLAIRWLKDYLRFRKQADGRFPLLAKNFYPCLHDKTSSTSFDYHYVYHTSWAARKVKQIVHPSHVDIGSSLYFSCIVSAFKPVHFYDYRPAHISLSGLTSREANLTDLPWGDGTQVSLSCMHTIEHIGLGRYGDHIDPMGDIKAAKELERVLAADGRLLVVVPVGRARIQFNAHRIYSYSQVVSLFPGCKVEEFSLVTDEGKFLENADPKLVDSQAYGCGCFMLRKI